MTERTSTPAHHRTGTSRAHAARADRPQVRPTAEGWKQPMGPDGRPTLQFAQRPRVSQPPTHLADLSLAERQAKMKELGLPDFRAKQLSVHYFTHHTTDPEKMSDLPAARRQDIVDTFLPQLLTEVKRLVTDDGRTIKFEAPGRTPVTVPAPRAIHGFAGEIWQTRRINVNTVHRACSDGMSDRSYPFTVTLMVMGEQREGCAWTDKQPFSGPQHP